MKSHSLWGLFFLLVLGMGVLLFVTRSGMGLSPDSASYLYAARSLLNGEGLREIATWNETIPMVRYGPLLSILLAGIGIFGADPLRGIRGLHVFLFGANIFLAGFLTQKYSRSLKAAVLSSALILTSIAMLEVHSMVWSEPLFIFLGFLGLYWLSLFLEDNQKYPWLFTSATAVGLAFLDRYAGVSFVAAGILGVWLLNKKTGACRAIDGILFGAIGWLPMTLWMIRNYLLAKNPTGTSLSFDPHLLGYLRYTLATLSGWLLPGRLSPLWRGLGLLLAGLFLFWAAWKVLRKEQKKAFLILLILFIGCHLGLYLATAAFVSPQDPDNRALSPVFFAGVVFAVILGSKRWGAEKKTGILRAVFILAGTLLVGSCLVRGTRWVLRTAREGQGYASTVWQNSELIQEIKSLPEGIPFYTNGWDAVYLLTGRASSSLPAKINKFKAHVNRFATRDEYQSELSKMREDLRNKGGILAYFNRIGWRWYYPSAEELEKEIGFPLSKNRYADGIIYQAADRADR